LFTATNWSETVVNVAINKNASNVKLNATRLNPWEDIAEVEQRSHGFLWIIGPKAASVIF
jgi:hypothetical protein